MNKISHYWLRITVACIAYIFANVFDYFMTVEGIKSGRNQEGNPIIQHYIDYFGLQNGVLFYKSLMCILIILATLILDVAYSKKAKSSKPIPLSLYFLYFGSFATILAGISWW
jgi:hypothetical protein